MTTMDEKSSRANEIDLLRFLAALAVVFFHYAYIGSSATQAGTMYPWLARVSQYGYLGVDLFFLISGFVIMMSASQGRVGAFVASRVSRLYPAFWVCCTATFTVLMATGNSSVTLWAYLVNMTLIGTAAPVSLVDASYWSLAVEIRFYALVALVLAVGQLRRAESLMLIWLAITVAMAFHPVRLLEVILVTKYSAYFVAGATFFFVWARGLTLARGLVLACCLLLAEYLALDFAYKLQERDGVVFEPAAVAGTVAAWFLCLLLIALHRTGRLARVRWLALGALTYPLYLLHQSIGLALFHTWAGTLNPHALFWGMIFLMIGSAWFVHAAIERRAAAALKRGLNSVLSRPNVAIGSVPAR